MAKETRLVFSTGLGRIRPDPELTPVRPSDSVVRIRRETKGRGGKEATVIWDVPGGNAELKQLASAIKQRLGTGGAAKDGQIVIQGDHVQTLIGFLKDKGYSVKQAGG